MPARTGPPVLDGLLFFPVTAFAPDCSFDPGAYRAHLDARLDDGPAAVFAACGTGEFAALAPAEYERCVSVAVDAAGGRVPVVSGTGYGTALALAYARAAQDAGADALRRPDRPPAAGRHHLSGRSKGGKSGPPTSHSASVRSAQSVRTAFARTSGLSPGRFTDRARRPLPRKLDS